MLQLATVVDINLRVLDTGLSVETAVAENAELVETRYSRTQEVERDYEAV